MPGAEDGQGGGSGSGGPKHLRPEPNDARIHRLEGIDLVGRDPSLGPHHENDNTGPGRIHGGQRLGRPLVQDEGAGRGSDAFLWLSAVTPPMSPSLLLSEQPI